RARTIDAASGFWLALRRRLLVSERPLTRRRNSPFRFRALSIRLSRRTRNVSDSGPTIHRARAHVRRATMGTRAAHHFAAGAAGNKRWRVACLARDAQRHRRERIPRRAHPDAVDLHHLAQPRDPRRRATDRL